MKHAQRPQHPLVSAQTRNQSFKQAYIEGWRAAWDGQTDGVCPYKLNGSAFIRSRRHYWLKGHAQGVKEIAQIKGGDANVKPDS